MSPPRARSLQLCCAALALASMTTACDRLQALLPGATPAPTPNVAPVGVPLPGAPPGAAPPSAPSTPAAWTVTVSRDPAQVAEFAVPPVIGATQVAVFAFAADTAMPAWTWVGAPGRVRYGEPSELEPALTRALGDAVRDRLPAPASFSAVAFDAQGGVVATIARRPL